MLRAGSAAAGHKCAYLIKNGRKSGAEFGSGAFKVAFKHKAPIIPVCIDGSYKIMEANNGKWIKPGHVIVTVLPAIETADMERSEQKTIDKRIREELLAAREASRASYKANDL